MYKITMSTLPVFRSNDNLDKYIQKVSKSRSANISVRKSKIKCECFTVYSITLTKNDVTTYTKDPFWENAQTYFKDVIVEKVPEDSCFSIRLSLILSDDRCTMNFKTLLVGVESVTQINSVLKRHIDGLRKASQENTHPAILWSCQLTIDFIIDDYVENLRLVIF